MAFATWNPSDKGSAYVLTGSNLIATKNSDVWQGVRATVGKGAGKYYWEQTVTAEANFGNETICYGICLITVSVSTEMDQSADSYGWGSDGQKVTGGSRSAYGGSWSVGDVIMFAWDATNGKVWFGKNGTWQSSGDPAAGTNAAFTGLSGTFYPFASMYYTIDSVTGNFGGSAFVYTVPTGFTSGLSPVSGPTNVKTWDGVTQSTGVSTYFGVALASVKSVNGVN